MHLVVWDSLPPPFSVFNNTLDSLHPVEVANISKYPFKAIGVNTIAVFPSRTESHTALSLGGESSCRRTLVSLCHPRSLGSFHFLLMPRSSDEFPH